MKPGKASSTVGRDHGKTALWPWKFPPMETADIVAVQALANGTANEGQQKRAYEFIRVTLCGSEKMTFWPGAEDGRRATDFAEGKRWVASALWRISRLRPSEIDTRGAPPAMPGEPEE